MRNFQCICSLWTENMRKSGTVNQVERETCKRHREGRILQLSLLLNFYWRFFHVDNTSLHFLIHVILVSLDPLSPFLWSADTTPHSPSETRADCRVLFRCAGKESADMNLNDLTLLPVTWAAPCRPCNRQLWMGGAVRDVGWSPKRCSL